MPARNSLSDGPKLAKSSLFSFNVLGNNTKGEFVVVNGWKEKERGGLFSKYSQDRTRQAQRPWGDMHLELGD
ncbi:hypothetical protein SUGI_0960700 [Cryptomeria japonica]|nr:hypothetical protein SUGI_0960700 [Cryptomeria japonica]